MDLPAAVVAHLHELVASGGADREALLRRIWALTAALRAGTASYRGFRLTLLNEEQPVVLMTLTAADRQQVLTSLHVPLDLLDPAIGPGSTITLYAGSPGAFVDLAADLGQALATEVISRKPAERDGAAADYRHSDGNERRPIIAIDLDLPPVAEQAGLSGVAETSAINQALGILIAQGRAPDDASRKLRRDAATAGLATHVYAHQLVSGQNTG